MSFHLFIKARTAELIQYEGASSAMMSIVQTLAEDLINVIPSCRDHYFTPVITAQSSESPQVLVNSLQVCSSILVYIFLPYNLVLKLDLY